MGTEGFFTRVEAKGKLPTKSSFTPDMDPDTLHRMGLRGVRDMNPDARTPCMEPSGDPKPDVYILGGFPSRMDDKKGYHHAGANRSLDSELPRDVAVRWDNVCRTYPPKGRDPKWHEVECFRPSVVESIEKAKPLAIIGLGPHALRWALPGISGGVRKARGRRFPIRVGDHACWFYPIMDPEYVAKINEGDRPQKIDAVGADEWEKTHLADIKRIVKDLSLRERPTVVPPDTYFDGLRIVTDPDEVEAELKYFKKQSVISLDVETSCLSPYSHNAVVLSLALSAGKRTLAIPLDHPAVKASRATRAAIHKRLRKLLCSGKEVVAQNLAFDLEWLIELLGPEIARGSVWHDTMVQAFVLDQRIGALNLDYLCRQNLGIPLKSIVPVNHDRLEAEPLEKLLKYNALDAKYTLHVHASQMERLVREKLGDVYTMQMRRIPTTVLAQRRGICVDADAVVEFAKRYSEELNEIEREAKKLPEVKEYISRFGSFSLSSSAAIIKIFRDIIQDPLTAPEGGGKYSADAKTLEKVRSKIPLAGYVLDFRRITKLKGTYVDRFHPKHPETYVYPDGKIHCKFNTTVTATGRLSSNDPNMQNAPKRRDKEVRRMIVPPKKHVILSSDYGQIEARVIAMASKDAAFVQALQDDYDIHMHWAETIRDAWPKTFKKRGSDLKKFRSDIKNQWVFPQFFGASAMSCARALEMPKEVAAELAEEFWQMFPTIKKWQQQLARFYKKTGYVECLTGRRRHGPLSWNMIINTPIQGTASDIVVNAMDRISEEAEQSDRPWLQPVLNIHDDLTFTIPKKKLDEAVDTIQKMMCDVPYDFVNVPITIEMEAGKNWASMKEIGVFTSNQ